MQIEISQPDPAHIRLAVLETERQESPQFRLALMSAMNHIAHKATSVDILALGWYPLCRNIERHCQQEYELEKRVCEAMIEKGYPNQAPWREPLTWIYAGQAYASVDDLRDRIRVPAEQIFDLGQFTVAGDRLRVSDPCYEIGTWCAGEIAEVRRGTWRAQSVMGEEGAWGARVRKLQIRHADAPADIFATAAFVETDIDVGVDSGQAGFFDASRYPTDPAELEYEPGRFYGECCELTLDNNLPGGGVIPQGFGVVTRSGFGDGSYSCRIIRDTDGQVIAASISFIAEEEDEETDD
jgi:hypothetical protein